jgi:Domain of unknown function (DUF5615)
MPIALYMDQHVPRAITLGLRLRGVDVITAHEDGTSEMEDPDLLDRAGVLERVLFTRDDDLLGEATSRHGFSWRYLYASITGVDRDMRAGFGNHRQGGGAGRLAERAHIFTALKSGNR